MKIKIIILLTALVFISSCKQTYKDKIKTIEHQNLMPNAEKENNISIGKTITFGYSETQGIDRSRYPAPKYSKEIDKTYFEFLKTEEINDGSDGGQTYYYDIYKAIKRGATKIDYYKTILINSSFKNKNEPAFDSSKKELIASYLFTIK